MRVHRVHRLAIPRTTWARRQHTTTPHDPLRPSVQVSDLGLPLKPLPPPAPIPSTTISRDTLTRLCRMSALNPPAEGSAEETKLLEDLGGLVGLMDLVSAVQVEGEVRDLLTEGTAEVVFTAEGSSVGETGETGEDKHPRLLEYATRRVGEFYGFKGESK